MNAQGYMHNRKPNTRETNKKITKQTLKVKATSSSSIFPNRQFNRCSSSQKPNQYPINVMHKKLRYSFMFCSTCWYFIYLFICHPHTVIHNLYTPISCHNSKHIPETENLLIYSMKKTIPKHYSFTIIPYCGMR